MLAQLMLNLISIGANSTSKRPSRPGATTPKIWTTGQSLACSLSSSRWAPITTLNPSNLKCKHTTLEIKATSSLWIALTEKIARAMLQASSMLASVWTHDGASQEQATEPTLMKLICATLAQSNLQTQKANSLLAAMSRLQDIKKDVSRFKRS